MILYHGTLGKRNMNSDILSYYDTSITEMIHTKYGFSIKDSLEKFIMSETYKMLTNPELEMFEFSPFAIFDLWETEVVTGDPRNSLYLRRDEID